MSSDTTVLAHGIYKIDETMQNSDEMLKFSNQPQEQITLTGLPFDIIEYENNQQKKQKYISLNKKDIDDGKASIYDNDRIIDRHDKKYIKITDAQYNDLMNDQKKSMKMSTFGKKKRRYTRVGAIGAQFKITDVILDEKNTDQIVGGKKMKYKTQKKRNTRKERKQRKTGKRGKAGKTKNRYG
jgi:hypothetical protein